MDYIIEELNSMYNEIQELENSYSFETATLRCGELINFALMNLGQDHPYYIVGINTLANIYSKAGNYVAAKPLYKQAISMYKKVLGESHPNYIASLNNLAQLYMIVGSYDASERLYKKVLEIYDKNSFREHINYAAGLNNLAILYHKIGRYNEAELKYNEALQITKGVCGEKDSFYGMCLNNLGELHLKMGDHEEAKYMYFEGLKIIEENIGRNSIEYVTGLNNLALLSFIMGHYEDAESLYKESIETLSSIYKYDHPDVATSLNNLADLYTAQGNYSKAEDYHRKALEIRSKVLGDEHPDYAMSLYCIAILFKNKGSYEEAKELYKRAYDIQSKSLGEFHPSTADSLLQLAITYLSNNKPAKAYKYIKRAMKAYVEIVSGVIHIPDEQRQLKFINNFRGRFYIFLSFVNKYMYNLSNEELEGIFNIVLQNKGISTEVSISRKDKLFKEKSPELQEKLNELNILKSQIAQKMLEELKGTSLQDEKPTISQWEERRRLIEKEISIYLDIQDFGLNFKNIDYRKIIKKLPMKSALIELVKFRVYDFKAIPLKEEKAWGEERYTAFILRKDQPSNLKILDLGSSEEIDKSIINFRNSIRDSIELDDISIIEISGEDISKRLFLPLIPYLQEIEHLLIAPDGEITKLPFEVLKSNKGKYAIDKYKITYINTGRDLLYRHSYKSDNSPIVISNPNFDFKYSCCEKNRVNNSYKDLRKARLDELTLDDLPYTEIEGWCVSKTLSTTPFTGRAALKKRIREVNGPSIFHIATHGFFLEDQPIEFKDDFLGKMQGRNIRNNLTNPLLRSGLALAGAKTWLKGGKLPIEAEDGLLTSEDITSMNLRGTEIAVLSACETGLGEIKTGEGVFGLRRAFFLAGVRTLIMSLWQVDDLATTILMDRFYYNLIEKRLTKVEALRRAQLFLRDSTALELSKWWDKRLGEENEISEILDSFHKEFKPFENPFYWGAFICQGDHEKLLF